MSKLSRDTGSARKTEKRRAVEFPGKKSEAQKLRKAFESAISSLMYAPRIYGSPPEKPANSKIGFLDFAIEHSRDVDLIKKLLEWKAKVVTEEEAEKAKERERWRIKLRPDEMDVIVKIALDVLSGHDPRQLLGIKPTRGKRVDRELEQFEFDVAVYAWALRLGSVPMRAKAAALEVSRAVRGLNPNRVEKIARKHKKFATGVIELNPHIDHAKSAKGMLEFMLAISAKIRADRDSGVTPIPHK